MITHAYKGTEFKGTATTRKIDGLQGWFITRNTKVGGFAIIAKFDNGKGYETRTKARTVIKHCI